MRPLNISQERTTGTSSSHWRACWETDLPVSPLMVNTTLVLPGLWGLGLVGVGWGGLGLVGVDWVFVGEGYGLCLGSIRGKKRPVRVGVGWGWLGVVGWVCVLCLGSVGCECSAGEVGRC